MARDKYSNVMRKNELERYRQRKREREKKKYRNKCRDEDPDPVGSVDFLPAGSYLLQRIYKIIFILNKIISRIKKFKHQMMVYKIEFYAYLPKM